MNENHILSELKFLFFLILLNIMLYICYFEIANDITALLLQLSCGWIFYIIFLLGDFVFFGDIQRKTLNIYSLKKMIYL
ncbi:hypothetical protein D0A61_05885 [Pantoea agglomerans]|nr:hypothetical protein D0A61_05885 [Pantoea agglomerans]